MWKIETVAIANRGEVAVRIIRACQELGLKTVLLHSEIDKKSLAYRLCDQPVCIGGAEINESYLNIQANVQGALSAKADAIHPGFGFLSENADFAKACENNRLVFIGPKAESIELFGDKISAKKLVSQVGVPTIPGYSGEDQSITRLIEECNLIGYPVMVKATAGGGGRGLRVIESADKAPEVIESAQREGLSAFASKEVFLEKYLNHSKHIEVQVFGDISGQVFVVGERECSIQRRHQKIVEEAPSYKLPYEDRLKIHAAAKTVAEQAKYLGAGTVEFLYQDGEFFFLEMNTRLQVEHPVTELVMGVDLVKAQLITAQQQSVSWNQEQLQSRGHSIECRIYAEDPYNSGVPSTGIMGSCHFPQGPGRRFEVGFEAGDEVSSFYDSMIAKVIVWDESRPRAIQKMKRTLLDTIIFGVKTNIPYLMEILSEASFVDASMTTQFIETHFPKGLEKRSDADLMAKIGSQLHQKISGGNVDSATVSQHPSPWLHGWRR